MTIIGMPKMPPRFQITIIIFVFYFYSKTKCGKRKREKKNGYILSTNEILVKLGSINAHKCAVCWQLQKLS
jgi:hypothetical protein